MNKGLYIKRNRGYLFTAQIRHHHLYFGRLKGRLKNKMEGCRCAPFGVCWHGEVGDGVTRSGTSYVIVLGAYLAFCGCCWLGRKGKNVREAVSYSWPSPEHAVPVVTDVEVWLPRCRSDFGVGFYCCICLAPVRIQSLTFPSELFSLFRPSCPLNHFKCSYFDEALVYFLFLEGQG